jgi:hypothetical protein
MLSRALKRFRSSPAASPVTDARKELREAFAKRDRAAQALKNATAHADRVRAVVDDAAAADRELKAAESAAAESTRAWAASGAQGDGIGGAVYDRAAKARAKADRARLQAQGAQRALREVEEAERDARTEVSSAEDAIRAAAIGAVLTDVAPELAALEAAVRPLAIRYTRLVALANVLRKDGPTHPWARQHPHRDLTRYNAHEPLAAALHAMPFREPAPEESLAHADEWAREIRRLMEAQ